ncbi:MAG: hypothetical protein APR53_02795 [Methanoculleus sp. SDB]|nr:MAG: hypothetical protein APR53_02795 [Methanoculleus sp. SDB]
MSPKIRVNSSEWFYEGCESRITQLALALKIFDKFTNKIPLGHLFFSIDGKTVTLSQNLSGYYLILDIDSLNGNGVLTIESDFYMKHQQSLQIPDLTTEPLMMNPVVPISLNPNPQYPFPSHATLVRGSVKDGAYVADADVKVRDRVNSSHWAETTRTDSKGEFVLFFKNIQDPGETISIRVSEGGREEEKGETIFPRKTTVMHFFLH